MGLFLFALTVAKPLQWHLEILSEVIIPVYKVVGILKKRKSRICPGVMILYDMKVRTDSNSLDFQIRTWCNHLPISPYTSQTGRSAFFLSSAWSALLTPHDSLALQHPPKQCWPLEERGEILLRSKALGCPATWIPELALTVATSPGTCSRGDSNHSPTQKPMETIWQSWEHIFERVTEV